MSRLVYFAERDGLIKIGCTGGPLNWRMRHIKGAKLIGWLRGGFIKERSIHKTLREFSVGHEWFRDCQEVRAYMAEHANTKPRMRTVKARVDGITKAMLVQQAKAEDVSLSDVVRFAINSYLAATAPNPQKEQAA